MLEVIDISKSFSGVHALKSVSMTFHDGEIHGLLGGNGAGKSTLMKVVSGVYPPDSGSIDLNGKRVAFNTPTDAYSAGIRIVHQELSLIRSLTIAENLFIHKFTGGAALKWVDRNTHERNARSILSEWKIDVAPSAKASEVSMGIRQQVEIARELSTGGNIIILDEPTSSLTNKEIKQLFTFIKSLRDQGFIVIFISHRLNEVTELVDRMTVLRDGEVIGSKETKNINVSEFCKLVSGKHLNDLFPKTQAKIGGTALEIANLSGEGFRNISFEVRWGEIVGVAGLMGSGRSELLRAIFGLDELTSGDIILEGIKCDFKTPDSAILAGLIMLSENRTEEGILPDLCVSNNIVIMKLHDYVHNMFLDGTKIDQKVQHFMTMLNIVSRKPQTQLVSELSGGNQQKVVLGRLLGASPKILLLDEPTRGIDIANKIEIHKIMGQMVSDGGAIIMVSSELEELVGICDKVIVLHEGDFNGMFEREEFDREAMLKCMMGNGHASNTASDLPRRGESHGNEQ